MSNRVYDILKYISLVLTPALMGFLTSLGQIWAIDNMPLIVSTIGIIGTFIGALLQISSIQYSYEQDGIYSVKTANNFETLEAESPDEEE